MNSDLNGHEISTLRLLVIRIAIRKSRKVIVPVKTGTHFATGSGADEWIPAFAGMTIAR
jgi:hypothetical protein